MKKIIAVLVSLIIMSTLFTVNAGLVTQPNLLGDGDFSSGGLLWTDVVGSWRKTEVGGDANKSETSIGIVSGESGFSGNAVRFDITKAGDKWWSYSIRQIIPMSPKKTYTVSFKAKASAVRYIDLVVQRTASGNPMHRTSVKLETTVKEYSYTFNTCMEWTEVPTEVLTALENAYVGFNGGDVSRPTDPTATQPSFWIADVSVVEAPHILSSQNILRNSELNTSSFGNDWQPSGNASLVRVENTASTQHNLHGKAALTLQSIGPKGADRWNHNLKQPNLPAIPAGSYRLSFFAYRVGNDAVNPLYIFTYPGGGDTGGVLFEKDVLLTESPALYTVDFTLASDRPAGAALYFTLHKMDLGTKIAIDSIMITPIPKQFAMEAYTPTQQNIVYNSKNFSFKFDSPILSASLKNGAVTLNGQDIEASQMAIDSSDNTKLNVTLTQAQRLTENTVFEFPALESIYGYSFDGDVSYDVIIPPPVTVTDVVYKKGNTEIFAIQSGDITLNIDMEASETGFRAIAVVYEVINGVRVLKDIDYKTITETGPIDETLTVTVPAENTANCEILLYMWSDFDGLAPLIDGINAFLVP